MHEFNYNCPKCRNTECEVGEFRATGGFLSKVFDVQSKRFTTVICTNCHYTEIYRASSSLMLELRMSCSIRLAFCKTLSACSEPSISFSFLIGMCLIYAAQGSQLSLLFKILYRRKSFS